MMIRFKIILCVFQIFITVSLGAQSYSQKNLMNKKIAEQFVRDNIQMLMEPNEDQEFFQKMMQRSSLADPPTQLILSDPSTPCPSGWKGTPPTCYFQSSGYIRWEDANTFCNSRFPGSHLASIHSDEERRLVTDLFSDDSEGLMSWIGMRFEENGKKYWTDGTGVDYNSWVPGYPESNAGMQNTCTLITNNAIFYTIDGYQPGQFMTANCTGPTHKAICKYITVPTVPTVPPPLFLFDESQCPPNSCGENWVQIGMKCYAILEGPSTYENAVEVCRKNDGELVKIQNAEENEQLRVKFSTNIPESAAWIGQSSYSNWAPGFSGSGSECPLFALSAIQEFGYSRGVWSTAPCSNPQKYAICSKEVEIDWDWDYYIYEY